MLQETAACRPAVPQVCDEGVGVGAVLPLQHGQSYQRRRAGGARGIPLRLEPTQAPAPPPIPAVINGKGAARRLFASQTNN